jgi:hypothetical protein
MIATQCSSRRQATKTTAKVRAGDQTEAPEVQTGSPSRPGGKLGKLVEKLETAEGATLAELTDLTGWQPHTVRAALTRLRQRRFKIRLEARNGRRAYRLNAGEG